MRLLETLLFSLRCRLKNGSRISATAYVKGGGNVRVGAKCKIHNAASIDASRGPASTWATR